MTIYSLRAGAGGHGIVVIPLRVVLSANTIWNRMSLPGRGMEKVCSFNSSSSG